MEGGTPQGVRTAPNISFAIPAPVPPHPTKAPGAPHLPQPQTHSPEDAALADLLGWICTIQQGCADEMAHALHVKMLRQYGACASSFPQSPIRGQWGWLRTHAPTLSGMAEVLKDFMPNPAQLRKITEEPATSLDEAAAANQATGAAQKKPCTPQKTDPQLLSKALWVGLQAVDNPPAGDVDASLLGGIVRNKFRSGLLSISDAQLNHTARLTILEIKPADYDRGMKLIHNYTVRGWKIS